MQFFYKEPNTATKKAYMATEMQDEQLFWLATCSFLPQWWDLNKQLASHFSIIPQFYRLQSVLVSISE